MLSLLASKKKKKKKKNFPSKDALVVNFPDKITFSINKCIKFSCLVNFTSQIYTYTSGIDEDT